MSTGIVAYHLLKALLVDGGEEVDIVGIIATRLKEVIMEQITKLLDTLPASAKYLIIVMFGLQVIAFSGWIIMMLRESKNSTKEKES